jgi:thiol-disulfide isomerase/thioredoxin
MLRKLPLLLIAASAFGQIPAGQWDGVVRYGDNSFPFLFEISGSGNSVKATFFNGDARFTSNGGQVTGNSIKLTWDSYAATLEATLTGGVLKGTYGGKRLGMHDFEARPHKAVAASANPPSVGGVWIVPAKSSKNENAWRLILRQKGGHAEGAILRVDGDTGLLEGEYRDGKFTLTHFDGSRTGILEVSAKPDGSLGLSLLSGRGKVQEYSAVKATEAKAKGVADPDDFTLHTSVKDPNEAFRFSFPDLNGKIISNTDARFRGKVVLVNVTGSWCPNCHDEAPFLESLYKKYKALGLEIVALDFEEPEQLQDPVRLRAFIKQYGLDYTYLIGGDTADMNAKIPQGKNLDSWPTTFILGRDGKVKEVHAGFPAKASGEFHEEMKQQFTATIERLLADNASPSADR